MAQNNNTEERQQQQQIVNSLAIFLPRFQSKRIMYLLITMAVITDEEKKNNY